MMPSGRRARLPMIGFSGAVTRLERANPLHVHAEIELNLLLSGSMRYLFAGRVLALRPDELCVFWAGLPHTIVTVDQPGELLWVTVPIGTAMGWNLGRSLHRLMRGDALRWRIRAGFAEQAREWVAALRGGGAQAQAIVALEVEAVLRRLEGPVTGLRAPAARGGTALAQVEAIAAWLDERYRDGIDWDELRRVVDLHPRHAMTVFRRICGMTVGQYLAQLRLAHAQRELLTSDAPVLAIAMDAGFGSLARFYVAFKRAFGRSPAAYRRSASAIREG
jgi:AraC family transcriptional regulator, melibiose operon regulatory protein